MSGHGQAHDHGKGRGLILTFIVALLVFLLVLLHQAAGDMASGALDPTAMLALGFVVLGCYAIGALVEVVGLPHITGYLLAGLVFGGSFADNAIPGIVEFFGWGAPPAPFDRGVLNNNVLGQLGMLDTLAIALIAMSAGGELRLEALRKGLRAILGVLAGQYLTTLFFVTAFVVSISGIFPSIHLAGMDVPSPSAAIGLGLLVAAIAFATSPAATLAIINETGAEGPMSRTVLSTVVLKDVLVIVTFVVAKFVAATLLGGEAVSISSYLLQHVGLGLGLGLVLGIAVSVYLLKVGKQLLLFIVGVVYIATYVSHAFHADTMLMFLMVGFIVGNFSKEGEHLLEKVEQLALPTYVVFFAMAGAKLHVDQLLQSIGFALALFAVRAVSMLVGVRVGARLGDADPQTRRYGWLGFLAQAGVAITLAGQLAGLHGANGVALSTMVMGGIALNELIGPVMFKYAVDWAGEIQTAAKPSSADAGLPRLSVPPPPSSIIPGALGASEHPSPSEFHSWPDVELKNPWGRTLRTGNPELDQRVKDLEVELHAIVRDVSAKPLRDWRTEAEGYLRGLRREFLRHHRRLSVQARNYDDRAEDKPLRAALRNEQAELAERWRGIVLGRSAHVPQVTWKPDGIVEALDEVVAALPERLTLPYDPQSYEGRNDETLPQTVLRGGLLMRRSVGRVFGQPAPTRTLRLRDLGRFHLSGTAPDKLQTLIALFVQADRHLANRTRSVFDNIVRGYDELALFLATAEPKADEEEGEKSRIGEELQLKLKNLRADVEEELAIALDEVRRIGQDGTVRTATALGSGLKAIKREAPIFGTFHLPFRKRRSSRVFARRMRALELLGDDIDAHRRASAATYGMLAMELELVGLEARVKDVIVEHSGRLEGELSRRVQQKVAQVQDTLEESITEFHAALGEEHDGEILSASVREITDKAERAASEAGRVVLQFHDELRDESKISPVVDALTVAAGALTERYEVLEGRIGTGEWTLPAALEPVEVPFRDIVQARIDAHIGPELRQTMHEIARQVQPAVAALQDIERKVAFNAELAASELDVVAEETVPKEISDLLAEMIGAPLERHKHIIDEFASSSGEWPEEFGRDFREVVQTELAELRELLADGDFSRARLREFRRETESRKLRYRAEQLPNALVRMRQQATYAMRAIAGEQRVERWRDALGLPSPSRPTKLDEKEFAAPATRADLPLIYQRLFSADTMEAGDVLLGREREIHDAHQVLSRRAKGKLRSVALIGIDGVGKAAVSNAIVRTGRFKQVRRVALSEPNDGEIFEEVVKSGSDGQLVVVDGIHWLMSMEPGGFEPIRRFADLVIADAGRHAWLIHADALFWRFASTVAPLADAFPDQIELEPLSAEALKSAVMDRASHSGLGTSFERVEGDSRIEEWLARSASRIRGPMDHYFHELHEASGGLVRDALRLWLASIRGVQNDEIVRVGRVPVSPHIALARLSEEVLLLLYQIARQGWMHPRVLSHLFRVDEGTAHAQLARLTHLGILEELEGQIYRVEVHLRGALERVLADKGWAR